ncbi:hypothetical protein CAG99_19795 [Streptomyces marincola]|uniref:HTH luxR-type domain-containing protein n=2 Tax=Streptomyces marincola TaxID=2878388 RepID=A0A1W7D198_9ACTN|nr:hypothetical protein CAG99_19795 [Streptomyces marincola]
MSMALHSEVLTETPLPTWSSELERVQLLTTREAQTLALLAAGWPNRRIAVRLQVSERTVKAHVACILQKLQVESRLQAGLVALSYRHMYESTMAGDRAAS